MSNLVESFYPLEYKYSDLVSMQFNTNQLIEVRDKKISSFQFIISLPTNKNNGVWLYDISRRPGGVNEPGMQNILIEYDRVLQTFEHWISMISKYNSICLSKEEFLLK